MVLEFVQYITHNSLHLYFFTYYRSIERQTRQLIQRFDCLNRVDFEFLDFEVSADWLLHLDSNTRIRA